MRSFSDDRKIVTKKAYQIMKGMQDQNIIACLKHFPGYGDVSVDPHLDLPVAYHERQRLDEIEFYPYKFLIDQNAQAIMSAHIIFKNISDLPATMSKEIIDILIDDMNFKNLLITDALNMKALTNHYSIEDIALLSHTAGHDILLYGDHINPNVDDILKNQIPKAFQAIKNAYLENKLDIEKLDRHVLKILEAKERLNLFENRFVGDYNPKIFFNSKISKLKEDLFSNSITIVKNKNQLPFNIFNNFIYVSSKENFEKDPFVQELLDFHIDCFSFFYEKLQEYCEYRNVIFNVFESDITDVFLEKIYLLDPQKTTIVLFASPYFLKHFKNFDNIILAYQEDEYAYFTSFECIFRDNNATGILPIDIKSL